LRVSLKQGFRGVPRFMLITSVKGIEEGDKKVEKVRKEEMEMIR
jgi:hypothetical protein